MPQIETQLKPSQLFSTELFSCYFTSINEALSRYSCLVPNDLLKLKEKLQISEWIPVSQIAIEEGIVDKDHVQELKDSIISEKRMMVPMLLRARENEKGLMVYDIIDGFHRGNALMAIGPETLAKAEVLYGYSDEEMFDLRVMAANSVRSIKFARVGIWMQKSFEQTDWFHRGFTLTQIFALASTDSSGKILKFTPEDCISAKDWAKEKAKKWKRSIGSIYQDLMTAENAAPDLLRSVRSASGDHGISQDLNPAQLRALAMALPGQHDLQRNVALITKRNKLLPGEVTDLCIELKKAKGHQELIDAILKNPFHYLDREKKLENPRTIYRSRNSHYENPDNQAVNDEKEKEINELKKLLADAHEIIEAKYPSGNPFWWRTLPDLSTMERYVLERINICGDTPEEITLMIGTTDMVIFRILQSTYRKYAIYLEDKQSRNQFSTIHNTKG